MLVVRGGVLYDLETTQEPPEGVAAMAGEAVRDDDAPVERPAEPPAEPRTDGPDDDHPGLR